MKKKIILVIILILITVGLYVQLKDKPLFKVNNVICKPGDEITITIEMIDEADFVAGNFELTYDKEIMEYISYSKGEVLEKSAMDILNNDINNSKILFAYVANPKNDDNHIEKSKLINISFKIKDNIDVAKIKPIFKCTTLKDKEGNDIEFSIKQGTISVK